MAIKLITNYCKRLGLPGYSSHQFSVSIETELATTADIPAESERLYQLLQSNVDEQMQNTGFVPPGTYGMDAPNGNTAATSGPTKTNGTNGHAGPLDGRWRCSDKQRELILKLVDEHQLDKHQIESLAVERFGHGVRLLNKLEASGLLDELLAVHGGGSGGSGGNGGISRPAARPTNHVNGSAYGFTPRGNQSRKDAA
jgi:hypothetical protein